MPSPNRLPLLSVCLLSCVAIAAEPVPIEAFARSNTLSSPHLSPDGEHLALTSNLGEGNYALHILRMSDQGQTALLRLPRYELPLEVHWVDNKRLVIAKGREYGTLEAPIPTGEIIATDFDGENQTYVYGFEKSTRTRGIEPGFGDIEGLPETPNGHFYMRAYTRTSYRSTLYDVDTAKSTHKLVADINEERLSFALKRDGTPAFAMGSDDDDNYHLFRRDGDAWTPLPQEAGQFVPYVFTPDDTQVFGYYSEGGGPATFVRADASGQPRTVLAKDAVSSVRGLLWSAPPRQPFGAYVGIGLPQVTYFDPASPDAQRHLALRKALPGMQVDYVDHTSDGAKSLVYAHSDRTPGAWYVYERDTRKLARLLDSQAALPADRMGERRAFRFKASDGVVLDGIMTIPAGIEDPAGLPTVLLPHGGPYAMGDSWAYDTDAQFLASRGYLVLQVNYRGSLGRGANFEESGYMQWGTRIQDDLIEGVRWSVAQGHTDAGRVCVFGASFGGYSAMMTAAKAPDLIRCAIGFAGIYDLALMRSKGDIKATRGGRNYLDRVIGNDAGVLAANSPTSHAGEIKAAVLLIHGESDERAPFAHAKAMRAALQKAGKEPEWMAVPNEGHGFYNDDNNIAKYRKIEEFIAENIGGAAN